MAKQTRKALEKKLCRLVEERDRELDAIRTAYAEESEAARRRYDAKYWPAYEKHKPKIEELRRKIEELDPPKKNSESTVRMYLGRLSLSRKNETAFEIFGVYVENVKNDLEKALKRLGKREISVWFGATDDGFACGKEFLEHFTGEEILKRLVWTEIPNDATWEFLKNNVCVRGKTIDDFLDDVWEMDELWEDDREVATD